MKTHLLIASAVLACSALPAVAAEANDTESAQKIKALEAEIDALRAQLRAEGRVRGEDRNRQHPDRRPQGPGQRGPRNGMDRQVDRDMQIDIMAEGDMENMPEFVREMVMERMGGHGDAMSIIVNGEEMIVGDRGMHRGGDRRDEHHQVMHFDLGDMTNGGMEGEVHIEIVGDMDMGGMAGQLPHIIMSAMMDRHGWEEDMWHGEDRRHDEQDMLDEVIRRMEDHGLPMNVLEELMVRDEIGELDDIGRLDMLIDRLAGEGHDPGPIAELRHDLVERFEDHHGMHDEDPYFREGDEFVGKMRLTSEIAGELENPINVAIFCIWEARQHLEPQERLDVLFPIMADDTIYVPVRNASAMVVREAFMELGDRKRALETLATQIRINGSIR